MPFMLRGGRIASAHAGRTPIGSVYRGATMVFARYCHEAETLFAAMATKPALARKRLIDRTIRDLISVGIWSKLALFYMLAAHAEQAARLNWKNPAMGGLTGVAPFTLDTGFAGDGSNVLSPGLASSSVFTQNNAHAGVWTLNDKAQENADLGLAAATSDVRINPRNTSNQLITALNNAGTQTLGSIATSVGHVVLSRTSSASYARYKNGVSLGDALASSVAPTSTIRLLGASSATNRSTRTVSAAHWGAALTAGEVSSLHTILGGYLSGLAG